MKQMTWRLFFWLFLSVFLLGGAMLWGWQLGRLELSLGSFDRLLLGLFGQTEQVSTSTTTTMSPEVILPLAFTNSPACSLISGAGDEVSPVSVGHDSFNLEIPLECRFSLGQVIGSTTIIIKKDAARTVPGFSFPKYVVEIYNPGNNLLAQRIKIDPGLSEERNKFSPEFFHLRDDVNFDGERDAFILDNLGVNNLVGGWWLFNQMTGKFEKSEALSVLVNPRFSAEAKEITTYESVSDGGCVYEKNYLSFIDGAYREMKRERQSASAAKTGTQFKRVTEIYQSGSWKVASTTFLKTESCHEGSDLDK